MRFLNLDALSLFRTMTGMAGRLLIFGLVSISMGGKAWYLFTGCRGSCGRSSPLSDKAPEARTGQISGTELQVIGLRSVQCTETACHCSPLREVVGSEHRVESNQHRH